MMLGNFSIEQMEERSGITFPAELKEVLKDTRRETASGPYGKKEWHCFDIPFCLVVGSMEFAQEIYDYLKPFLGKFKNKMQIAVNGE